MPKTYILSIIETRAVEVTYYVEAENMFEAMSKASIGDTVEEEEGRDLGVTNREIVGNASELDDEPRRRGETRVRSS
jgi:hypothetical protein